MLVEFVVRGTTCISKMIFEFLLQHDVILLTGCFVSAFIIYVRLNAFSKSTNNTRIKRKNLLFDIENVKVEPGQPIPRSVNYHFTRKCNYQCGFCFHTAKNSYMLSLADAKRGLRLLKNAGKSNINLNYVFLTALILRHGEN